MADGGKLPFHPEGRQRGFKKLEEGIAQFNIKGASPISSQR
jgi:hypothetical protein